MNMPVDDKGTVHFKTTLFALIRESLSIRMGPGIYLLIPLFCMLNTPAEFSDDHVCAV